MGTDIKKRTELFIKDLHARESMRLGWYRQWASNNQKFKDLRERKSVHTAFLHDLLRKRDLNPVWYAKMFYYGGHLMGWFTALLPKKWADKIENTLEFWILMRYQKYLQSLKLDSAVRSMIEAIQMQKLNHNEPAADVISLIEKFISEEKDLLIE